MWLYLGMLWAQLGLIPISPTVSQNTDTFHNPWAGGWNSPQFSTIDVDGDGQAELFVYERVDDRCMVFKRSQGRWIYLPEADTLFPRRLLSAWVLLRDYDGDGDKDLFTNLNSNIRVLQNIAPPGTPPRWRVAYDTLITAYSPTFSSYLYSGRVDIPAIADVDGDGDIDLLVYEVLGTLIEWHKNQAMELLGRRDTLILKLQSACWGHVFENYDYNTNQFYFVEYQCGSGQRRGEESSAPLSQERVQHAGGTILAIDLNGDGLSDLIVGDDGPPYLIAGLNTGTSQIAHIDVNTAVAPFPAHAPLYMPSFPATYYEDVTGDGKPDLICANNSPLAGTDRYSVWMYENIGRPDSPAWAAPVVGWLHNTMLDVGTCAHPTLADINRDGYPDLILSNESFYTDTGTKARAMLLWGQPGGFTVADTNWLNLPQYTLRNPVFAAGDIDGNGRTDLIVGTSTGALWRWEEQTAGAADFSLLTQNFAGINGPPFAAPVLYDYDGDGDADIILGARNGRLSLYRQESGGTFTLVTDFLGQIELRDTISTLLGFTRPTLVDVDGNGSPEILVGNLTGFVRMYAPQWSAPTSQWNPLGELPYRWGKRASPAAWRIADSILVLIGNQRGGVHAFKLSSGTSPVLSLSDPKSNPYHIETLHGQVMIRSERPIAVQVYDFLGRKVTAQQGEGKVIISPLPPGGYVVSIRTSEEAFWERIWLW